MPTWHRLNPTNGFMGHSKSGNSRISYDYMIAASEIRDLSGHMQLASRQIIFWVQGYKLAIALPC